MPKFVVKVNGEEVWESDSSDPEVYRVSFRNENGEVGHTRVQSVINEVDVLVLDNGDTEVEGEAPGV